MCFCIFRLPFLILSTLCWPLDIIPFFPQTLQRHINPWLPPSTCPFLLFPFLMPLQMTLLPNPTLLLMRKQFRLPFSLTLTAIGLLFSVHLPCFLLAFIDSRLLCDPQIRCLLGRVSIPLVSMHSSHQRGREASTRKRSLTS